MRLFNRRKKATLQEELYKSVNARDLTPEELRASRLPDECIHAIWVKFTSDANNHYQAVHVHIHENEPYILLRGTDKDRQDFVDVKGIVANITAGSPQRFMADRTSDICTVINLHEELTQARVADFVEKYREDFGDVSTPVAYFHDVLRSTYESSGLPLKKLAFE